jgi:DNA polymerase-1
LAELGPELQAYGIDNADSYKQVRDFFEREGLLELFRRDGKISFDKKQLETYEDRHPAIPLLRASRRAQDLLQEKLISGEFTGADGRVHPTYKQLGAVTGRESSRWPNVMGLGKIFRPLVVPEVGRGIGEADWSQIEVGIAAAVYGDEKLIELYNTDDVYVSMAKYFHREELASEDIDLPAKEFKSKNRSLRERMKICTLGIIYGLTKHGLARLLNTTETEADALQRRFMTMFPELSAALIETSSYGAIRGHVSTISGLRRQRSRKGKLSNQEQNWMINHPVQGSAAVIFKIAGNRLDKLYRQYDAWLIIPMHDAFVFEAPLHVLKDVADLTERVMVEVVQETFPELRPRVDVNVQHPGCWNKDRQSDSLERWMKNPTRKS